MKQSRGQRTDEAIVTGHLEPLGARLDGVMQVHGLKRLELADGGKGGYLDLDLLLLVGLIALQLLGLGPLTVDARQVGNDGDLEGTLGAILIGGGDRARALPGGGAGAHGGWLIVDADGQLQFGVGFRTG
jgi:hypothetical protein